MSFSRRFKRRAQREEAFQERLALLDRVEKESKERMARTGERPRLGLARIDHTNRRVDVVAVDPPPVQDDL
jgi:hypothetical protein